MKNIFLIICTILALCSCSKGEYVDAIPSTATALVAIEGYSTLLADVENIDTAKTTYLFELAGGEMGLCALSNDGEPIIALLPSNLESDKKHQERLIEHMKDCEQENSIRNSQLWKHLQKVNGKMRMVAQTNVLPKQMQACLTLGCPKGTDPADVLLEAQMDFSDSILTLNGHTCSYNERVRQEIGNAFNVFKPITFDNSGLMRNNTLLGIFMNVEGTQFMPLLKNNKALNMMLMGTNAYERIQNNHGNMAVTGTIDNKWNVTTSIPDDTKSKNRLIVCLNMKALPEELENVIGFLTDKINKIVYKVE